MKILKNLNIFTLFIILLSGCDAIKKNAATAEISDKDKCTQVKTLIAHHKDGFKDLKGNIHITSRMDIWDAKYDLVGENCQIWRWSNGKQAYMCSLTVPNKEIAIEKQKQAISFSKQCLGNEWQTENIEREHGRAFRTIFSQAENKTVASIHRVKTEGLFKSEWAIYYFIGDRDNSL